MCDKCETCEGESKSESEKGREECMSAFVGGCGVCVYVCMCVCVYVCMYVYVCGCTYVCLYVSVYAWLFVHLFAFVCV